MNLKQLIKFGLENSSDPVIKNPILRDALEPRSMDLAALSDDVVPGSLKDELEGKFDPSQETHEEYLQRINLERPFNMAEGGQLVAPSVDGSRPGYGGLGENIYLNKDGTSYNVAVQAKNKLVNKSFNFSGYNKKYKNKTEALNAAKNFRDEQKEGQVKKIFQDEKKLKVANQYTNLLNKLNPKDKNYVSANKYLDLTNKMEKQKIIQIMKANDFKFTKNYSQKQRFPADKEKLLMEAFNLTEDDFIKHGKYGIPIRVGTKENSMMSPMRNFIARGFKFKKPKKSEILTLDQQEFVKNNFELPEGKEWNFKSLKNPNGFKYGVAAAPDSGTKALYKRIENRINDKNLSYTVAADRATPEGWMMNAMNRVYENEIKNKVKFENLTYQPVKNKKGIIIGFKDNTAAGGNKTYYGIKKNRPEDATAWTGHKDFNRINKFLSIAKGAQVDDPSKLLQKILDDKGITKLMGDKSVLTLNDILSHERYFNKLSETSPKALIERQIVLHHTRGVGSGSNLARAAATKDLQLLKSVVNAKIQNLEKIVQGTPTKAGRKLNIDEIANLKKYGAKIVDFDGKVVGGGYTDPTKQFAAIEKEALKYAKGDQFNVKTVASYLERLGCGKAAGGRILFAEGVPSLTKCAQKGVTKLENGLKNGFKNADEASLAKGILKSGRFLKDAVSLRGLFGPAALAFTAAAEAGIVGYDMLASGKSFREAVGDSVFNYMLGDRTKIDSVEERNKRMIEEGMTPEQMGKIGAMESALEELNTFGSQFNKLAAIQKNRDAISMSPEDTFSEGAFQLDLDRQENEARKNIQDFNRSGGPQRLQNIDYAGGFENLAEGLRRNELAQLQSVNNPLEGRLSEEKRSARIRELMLQNPDVRNYMGPYPTNYGFKEGGIASIRKPHAIPPKSGPTPQGLPSMLNRVRRI
jgi:hypothetical protein